MKLSCSWTWTNWTFGFWWGKFGRTPKRWWFGIDLGPLEMIWR